jgi:hypothetical protein
MRDFNGVFHFHANYYNGILSGTVAFGVPLIGITNFVKIIYNDHQAFATHMDTATSNEKTVVHQGIIGSSSNPQIKRAK